MDGISTAAVMGEAEEHPHHVAEVLRVEGIWKRFGDLVANAGVDFTVGPGEVHALLGENGAGKSTLMNILSGLIRPDAGRIVLRGRDAEIRSPRDATHLGIGMVHQHFRLIDRMTVAENLHLGWNDAPRVGGERTLNARTRSLGDRFGFVLDPSVRVGDLSVAEQQRVEIVRTLWRGAQILILDEPTAVLTPQEVRALFPVIRALAADGRSVIFISHKLREVLDVADAVSVMRNGRMVATLAAGECTEAMLARLMIGKELRGNVRPPRRPSATTVLRASSLWVKSDRGLDAVRGIDLEVHAGEIVGVAGVAGNGQRELAEALTGLRHIERGSVAVDGADLSHATARRYIDAGVGHIPEDRNGTGLVPSEPIWRNAILKRYRGADISSRLRFRRRVAKSLARALCESSRLSTLEVDTPVRELSGGNAQRLLTAREIESGRRVLVAVHPTRGVDVAGSEAIRDALLDAKGRDSAVLLISEDLDELLALSDRLVVLYEGRIAGEFAGGAVDQETLGLCMGSGTTEVGG